jgi:myosin heavy subunit
LIESAGRESADNFQKIVDESPEFDLSVPQANRFAITHYNGRVEYNAARFAENCREVNAQDIFALFAASTNM